MACANGTGCRDLTFTVCTSVQAQHNTAHGGECIADILNNNCVDCVCRGLSLVSGCAYACMYSPAVTTNKQALSQWGRFALIRCYRAAWGQHAAKASQE